MPNTIEEQDGVLLDAVFTSDDDEASEQLMMRTGMFLNMLEHCARFHPEVVTAEYLDEVLDDLDIIRLKFGLHSVRH